MMARLVSRNAIVRLFRRIWFHTDARSKERVVTRELNEERSFSRWQTPRDRMVTFEYACGNPSTEQYIDVIKTYVGTSRTPVSRRLRIRSANGDQGFQAY